MSEFLFNMEKYRLRVPCNRCESLFTPDNEFQQYCFQSKTKVPEEKKRRIQCHTDYKSETLRFTQLAKEKAELPKETKERFNGICQICQKQTDFNLHKDNALFPNQDHVISKAHKGPHSNCNFILLCRDCNINLKKDLPLPVAVQMYHGVNKQQDYFYDYFRGLEQTYNNIYYDYQVVSQFLPEVLEHSQLIGSARYIRECQKAIERFKQVLKYGGLMRRDIDYRQPVRRFIHDAVHDYYMRGAG